MDINVFKEPNKTITVFPIYIRHTFSIRIYANITEHPIYWYYD